MWIDEIRERAKSYKKHIVLPEGADDRMKMAADIITARDIARITLLDNSNINEETSLEPSLYLLRKAVKSLNNNEYDGLVAGAVNTTANVIISSLKTVGVANGCSVVSSFFLMEGTDLEMGNKGGFLFADCAVVPSPTAKKLADIAISTALSAHMILGWEPKVALLSFSTKGSASGEMVLKVSDAVDLIRKKEKRFTFDGELQFDSAVLPEIARNKDEHGLLKGEANVLIFPDLNSGNIAYKIAQRIGKMRAVGPILQGFKKPVNDLSRGCSAEDIVDVVSMTVLQAAFSE
ncbi:phosphate acyltransferase [Elusimicrobiota bacterium]